MDKAKDWAVRCVHEMQMHNENCFITLTYNDENLPPWGDLDKNAFPKFIKRLRKRLHNEAKKNGNAKKTLRYIHCGEYGGDFGRPHYHGILFGYDYPDKIPYKKSEAGNLLYRSALLEQDWSIKGNQLGHCDVGEATLQSSGYIARYTMAKPPKDIADDHYARHDPETGEIYWLAPEYTTQSTRPPIGDTWYDKFKTDVFPDDFIILSGKKYPVPKRYYLRLKEEDPDLWRHIKNSRASKFDKEEHTDQRNTVKEIIQHERIKKLHRN